MLQYLCIQTRGCISDIFAEKAAQSAGSAESILRSLIRAAIFIKRKMKKIVLILEKETDL